MKNESDGTISIDVEIKTEKALEKIKNLMSEVLEVENLLSQNDSLFFNEYVFTKTEDVSEPMCDDGRAYTDIKQMRIPKDTSTNIIIELMKEFYR